MNEAAVDTDNTPGKQGFPRRLLVGIGLAAALCYSIAFVQYSSGAAHYSAYVESYMACANDPLFGVYAVELCKTTPTVRGHLDSHTMANAMVVPTLSVALSLTIAALFLPFSTRGSRWYARNSAEAETATPVVS